MWSIIILSSFIFCATCSKECIYPDKMGNQPDYYWRDYYGVVPKDAVPGGYDETGNVTYIGQLAAPDLFGIYPGNLYSGQKEVVAAIKRKVVDGTYVRILCSNPANKYQWIRTTVEGTYLLTDYHFVVGGSEGKLVSYIGRANYQGQVQVGRVFITKEIYKGLWLLNKDDVEANVVPFELLVFPR